MLDWIVDRRLYNAPTVKYHTTYVKRLPRSGLPVLHFRKGQASRAFLLFHGNQSSLDDTYTAALQMSLPGDIVAFTYPGYPHARAAERTGADRDTELVDYLGPGVRECAQAYDQVWLLGHSLGCAVALRLVKDNYVRPDGIVLLSPFNKLSDVVSNIFGRVGTWLVGSRWDSAINIQSVTAKTLIIHGLQDTMVVPSQSAKLFSASRAAIKCRMLKNWMGHGLSPTDVVPDITQFVTDNSSEPRDKSLMREFHVLDKYKL